MLYQGLFDSCPNRNPVDATINSSILMVNLCSAVTLASHVHLCSTCGHVWWHALPLQSERNGSSKHYCTTCGHSMDTASSHWQFWPWAWWLIVAGITLKLCISPGTWWWLLIIPITSKCWWWTWRNVTWPYAECYDWCFISNHDSGYH